jgi:hypothetical protein
MPISSNSAPNPAEPRPSWLRPRAVFAYRGGTEKVLGISAATIETVSSDSFVTWNTTGFLRDVATGGIVHRPDGLQIRPQLSAQQPKGSTVPPTAAQAFAELYQGFDNSGQPQKVILGWMANITHGQPVEPWQHLMGLALIELGAEQFGLGAKVANPAGAGRRSSHRAKAADTQALIIRFGHYLAGGEPITQMDLGWLRSLLEKGMASVGLMPPMAVTPIGRPRDPSNSARPYGRARTTPFYANAKFGRRGTTRITPNSSSARMTQTLSKRPFGSRIRCTKFAVDPSA